MVKWARGDGGMRKYDGAMNVAEEGCGLFFLLALSFFPMM
jgi:hypothetical protein